MTIVFCDKCDNVMELKKIIAGTTAEYVCRSCGLSRNMKLRHLTFTEEIREKSFFGMISDITSRRFLRSFRRF